MDQDDVNTELATYVLNKIYIPKFNFRYQTNYINKHGEDEYAEYKKEYINKHGKAEYKKKFINKHGEAAYKKEFPDRKEYPIYSKLEHNSIQNFLISNLKIIPNYIDFGNTKFVSKFFEYKNELLYNRYIETLWGFIETEEKKNQTEKELLNIIYTSKINDIINKSYTSMLEGIVKSLMNVNYTFININSDIETNAHYNFFKVYKLIDFFLKMYTYFYIIYYYKKTKWAKHSEWDKNNYKYENTMYYYGDQPTRLNYLIHQIEKDISWYEENTTEIYFKTFLINLNKRIILQYKDKNVVLKTEYIILKDIKDEIVNVSTTNFLYFLREYEVSIVAEMKKFMNENGIKYGIFNKELMLNPKGQSGGVNIRCKSRSYTKKKKKKNQSYKKKYNMRMQRKTRRKL